jgi:hypothetical protein
MNGAQQMIMHTQVKVLELEEVVDNVGFGCAQAANVNVPNADVVGRRVLGVGSVSGGAVAVALVWGLCSRG